MRTFVMDCIFEEPIAWAASSLPGCTSRSAVSTRRAKNGIAAIASDTDAAMGPKEVPTIQRVKGIRASIRMA